MVPVECHNFEREPIKGPGLLGEYDAGMNAAVAVLGALYWCRTGGTGQHIDVSKQESLAVLDRADLDRIFSDGENPNRDLWPRPVRRMMVAKDDGRVLIQSSQDHQWRGLVKAMGNPEWAEDERFKTDEGRKKNTAEIQRHLDEWTKKHTAEEIFHMVQAAKSPAAPVNSPEAVVKSPQAEARGFFVEMEHPVAGKFKYPSSPCIFSRTPWHAERPAPLLGQHNEEVFCKRLGYSRQDLVKLKEAEVI